MSKLTPEKATELVMKVGGPPHAEVVEQLGPGYVWDAALRRFRPVEPVTVDREAAEAAGLPTLETREERKT